MFRVCRPAVRYLKRFPRSEVNGQGLSETKCTYSAEACISTAGHGGRLVITTYCVGWPRPCGSPLHDGSLFKKALAAEVVGRSRCQLYGTRFATTLVADKGSVSTVWRDSSDRLTTFSRMRLILLFTVPCPALLCALSFE